MDVSRLTNWVIFWPLPAQPSVSPKLRSAPIGDKWETLSFCLYAPLLFLVWPVCFNWISVYHPLNFLICRLPWPLAFFFLYHLCLPQTRQYFCITSMWDGILSSPSGALVETCGCLDPKPGDIPPYLFTCGLTLCRSDSHLHETMYKCSRSAAKLQIAAEVMSSQSHGKLFP